MQNKQKRPAATTPPTRSELRKLAKVFQEISDQYALSDGAKVEPANSNGVLRFNREPSHNAGRVYVASHGARDTPPRTYADIPPKVIGWRWPNIIPSGKLTLIAGHPGLGKSMLMANLAAIVSSGKGWPLLSKASAPGTVLIISGEDDDADTIRPRLEAAGADLTRCVPFKDEAFSLDNLSPLEAFIDGMREPPALITIDPISEYMGCQDGHNNVKVRRALARLAGLAARYDCAIVLVSHWNKTSGGSPLSRVAGSGAFVAAVRAAYCVCQDPADQSRRLFLPLKSNLSPTEHGFSYSIQTRTIEAGFPASFIKWDDEPAMETVGEVLNAKAKSKAGGMDGAQQFLLERLAAGPCLVSALRDEADACGFSFAALTRASKVLRVGKMKGYTKDREFWTLGSVEGEPGAD